MFCEIDILSCDIHTHASAPTSSTNFILYHHVQVECFTSCFVHGHGHERHSSYFPSEPAEDSPKAAPNLFRAEGQSVGSTITATNSDEPWPGGAAKPAAGRMLEQGGERNNRFQSPEQMIPIQHINMITQLLQDRQQTCKSTDRQNKQAVPPGSRERSPVASSRAPFQACFGLAPHGPVQRRAACSPLRWDPSGETHVLARMSVQWYVLLYHKLMIDCVHAI